MGRGPRKVRLVTVNLRLQGYPWKARKKREGYGEKGKKGGKMWV